jgi:hypothetical protein
MNLPIDSDNSWLIDLKKNDKLYVAEYASDENSVNIIEFIVKEVYGKKSTIEGVKNGGFVCDIVDVKFPKVTIPKKDVSHGFHKNPKDAIEEFASIIDKIYAAAHKKLEEVD